MCRLLGIFGQTENWRDIITAFSIQAETGNVPAIEKNNPGHKDGWGMTISNRKQTAMVPLIRQLGSAYEAPGYREALNTLPEQPDIFLCHLRKASDFVPISLSNTHPFFHNGWAFIHNGTVYKADTLPRAQDLVLTSDDSDTEYFFHYLWTKINKRSPDNTIAGTIVDAVSSLRLDYTSLNFMLSNGRNLYVVRCFRKHETHYTLYCYQLQAGFIFCSEPIEIEGLDHSRWTLLANKSLLEVQGDPPRIKEFKF